VDFFIYNTHKLKLKAEEDIEKLGDEVFVFTNKDHAPYYHNCLLDICSAFGIKPNVVHESNSISSIIRLVRNGMGISIVPSCLSSIYTSGNLGFIRIKRIQLSTRVLLVTPKDDNSEIDEAAISFLM